MNLKIFRAGVGFILLGYLVCLLYWMFIGFGRSHSIHGQLSYNVIPFKTIHQYIFYRSHFNFKTWFINIFGNIGVFAPFGFLLPLLFAGFRSFWRLMGLFILLIFGLELLQMFSRTGSFDVDDIILNSVGVVLGFIGYRLIGLKTRLLPTGSSPASIPNASHIRQRRGFL